MTGSCALRLSGAEVGRSLRTEPEPDLADIAQRYREFHAALGNDLRTGLRLDKLRRAARDAMATAEFATGDDIARWDAAFARADAVAERPTMFVPLFPAYGRNPG